MIRDRYIFTPVVRIRRTALDSSMDRPHWHSDTPEDRGSTLSVPPIRTWSANSLLLLTLVVVFFLQLVFDGFQELLELRPAALANPLQWYRLVTYSLLHSQGDLLHLGMNCLLLFYFGPSIEHLVGSRGRYLAFCAAGAAVAALTYAVETLLQSGSTPMIGASGICYAVLVAVATYDPQRLILFFGLIPVKLWALAAILMLSELLLSLMPGSGVVAHVAHLGGGMFGYAYIRYRSRFAALMVLHQQRRDAAARQRSVDRRQEIDRLLDKITNEGIGSLSRSERKFLESASREFRNPR